MSGDVGPGRHPLPAADDFTETLGRLGASPEEEVVIYDDVAGVIAARMWWMLRSIGNDNGRVLNGGFATWLDQGRAVETGWSPPTRAAYPPVGGFTGVVTLDQLDGRTVVDARSPERYRGETEPVDPKAGHIPGALSVPTAVNLDGNGLMRRPSELAATYSPLDHPVMSCGSGVTACHNALAMVVAGLDMPDVYIGSFSEWSRLDLPVTTGPGP